MTTRPQLKLGRHLLPGLASVALFVVMAAAFLSASFPTPNGFGSGSITASIGYALFDLDMEGRIASENFLIAFEIIDVVLVAALVASIMLARRDGGLFGGDTSSDAESAGDTVRTDGGDTTQSTEKPMNKEENTSTNDNGEDGW